MDEKQLQELERLAQAATPGPWRHSMSGYSVKSNDPDVPIVAAVHGGPVATAKQVEQWIPNAEFIAAVRDALPALLSTLRARDAACAAMRGALTQLVSYIETDTDNKQLRKLSADERWEQIRVLDVARAALASDAGTATLAELSIARAELEQARAEIERLRGMLSDATTVELKLRRRNMELEQQLAAAQAELEHCDAEDMRLAHERAAVAERRNEKLETVATAARNAVYNTYAVWLEPLREALAALDADEKEPG